HHEHPSGNRKESSCRQRSINAPKLVITERELDVAAQRRESLIHALGSGMRDLLLRLCSQGGFLIIRELKRLPSIVGLPIELPVVRVGVNRLLRHAAPILPRHPPARNARTYNRRRCVAPPASPPPFSSSSPVRRAPPPRSPSAKRGRSSTA